MKTAKRWLILGVCCCLLPAGAFAAAPDVLFETSVALYDGAEPTQFRVTQSAESAADFPDDAALAMEITPPEGDGYTLLFPSWKAPKPTAWYS